MTAGGSLDEAVRRRLARFEDERVMARLWDADTTLWKAGDDAHQRVVARSLGWLSVFRDVRPELGALEDFVAEVRAEGFRQAVLLGMGGSSLAPEVMAAALDTGEGALDLVVLDTTDPRAIASAERALDLEASLFVVASKSGGTVETSSLYAYFFERLGGCCEHGPGHHFIAITDPDTTLQREAVEQGFRAVFVNPDDIGGRYSALSFFGLVPAALFGADLGGLLDRADAMATACAAEVPAGQNPALVMGAWLAEAVAAGRDKLTLVASPGARGLRCLGRAARRREHRQGGHRGVPGRRRAARAARVVRRRPRRAVRAPGRRRRPRPGRRRRRSRGAPACPCSAASFATLVDLGGEFLLWELAVAVVRSRPGIDPFDQPNVQESKDNTKRVLAETAGAATARRRQRVGGERRRLRSRRRRPRDGARGADARPRAAGLRRPARLAHAGRRSPGRARGAARPPARRRGVATSAGFGPRFLHSTGQYHKGGPARGVFVQLVSEGGPELPVPGRDFSFRRLKEAQALGDLEALLAHGGRVLRVDLGEDAVAGLRRFGELLRRVLAAVTARPPGLREHPGRADTRPSTRRTDAGRACG